MNNAKNTKPNGYGDLNHAYTGKSEKNWYQIASKGIDGL